MGDTGFGPRPSTSSEDFFAFAQALAMLQQTRDTEHDARVARNFKLNIHIYVLTGYYNSYLPYANEKVSLNKKELN